MYYYLNGFHVNIATIEKLNDLRFIKTFANQLNFRRVVYYAIFNKKTDIVEYCLDYWLDNIDNIKLIEIKDEETLKLVIRKKEIKKTKHDVINFSNYNRPDLLKILLDNGWPVIETDYRYKKEVNKILIERIYFNWKSRSDKHGI